jgi:hypothetical protein
VPLAELSQSTYAKTALEIDFQLSPESFLDRNHSETLGYVTELLSRCFTKLTKLRIIRIDPTQPRKHSNIINAHIKAIFATLMSVNLSDLAGLEMYLPSSYYLDPCTALLPTLSPSLVDQPFGSISHLRLMVNSNPEDARHWLTNRVTFEQTFNVTDPKIDANLFQLTNLTTNLKSLDIRGIDFVKLNYVEFACGYHRITSSRFVSAR